MSEGNRMERNAGIVQAGAEQAARWLKGHLAYLAYRARAAQEGPAPRPVFSATCNQVRPGEVRSALIGGASQQVVIHKLILSPGAEMVSDWQGWTRQVMRDLAERQGQPVRWFGVLHKNTAMPHVHVVLTWKASPQPLAPLPTFAAADRRRSVFQHDWCAGIRPEHAQSGAETEAHP